MKAEKKFKNTFWFTFYHTIKRNFFLPLIATIGSCLIMLYAFFLSSGLDLLTAANEAEKTAELRKVGTYVFFNESTGEMPALLSSLLLTVSALLLGILMFRFVTSKKTVNIYYSLGVNREELYSARYLAGAVMVILSAVLPVLVTTIFNIYWFGSSAVLWKASMFYTVHFTVSALAAFSISAAVCSSVGTVSEAVAFSAFLVIFPTVIQKSAVNLACAYSYGLSTDWNDFKVYGSPAWISIHPENSLFGRIVEDANLLFLNINNAFDYEFSAVMTKEALKNWAMPSLMPYLLWTLGIAAFFTFGIMMFKHRKAESCGFAGRNKVLNIFVSLLLAVSALAFTVSIIWDHNRSQNGFNAPNPLPAWCAVALGIVFSAVFFILVSLILLRNKKAFLKELKLVPLAAMLSLVVSIPVTTGLFGYLERIPELSRIESAAISMPNEIIGSDLWLNPERSGSFAFEYYGYYCGNARNELALDNLKSQRDIETVRTFQKALLDAENSGSEMIDRKVAIKYTLKNGREMQRVYPQIPVELYIKLFEIEDSDRWNGILEKRFANLDVDKNVPVIFSKQMGRKTIVDKELRFELMQAVLKDVKALDCKSFWQMKSEWLGSLNIYYTGAVGNAADIYWDDPANAKTAKRHDYFFDESEAIDCVEDMWTDRNGHQYTRIFNCMDTIPITKEMVNTIAFLKEHSLYGELEEPSPVVSAKVSNKIDGRTFDTWDPPYSLIFCGFWDKGGVKATQDGYYYSGQYTPKDAIQITDKATLDKLQSNAYGFYLEEKTGYVVEFKHEDGSTTIMYVPNGRVNLQLNGK